MTRVLLCPYDEYLGRDADLPCIARKRAPLARGKSRTSVGYCLVVSSHKPSNKTRKFSLLLDDAKYKSPVNPNLADPLEGPPLPKSADRRCSC